MFILGISAYYHDSAACLLKNGKIVVVAQEERFLKKDPLQKYIDKAKASYWVDKKL